jgi:ribose transport system substrate-binding protein
MMTRWIVCAVCAVVLGAGCGGSGNETAEGPKEKVIGATLLTATHVFFQDMVVAMEAEAKAQGFKLRVQFAEFDDRRQNDQMETFIQQKVDAILLAPANSSGFAPIIAEARAKGIPVFTVDIRAHDSEVVSHIASDNEQGGYLAGQYLAKLLNGQGKVAIIDHPVVASVQDRTKGFDRAMAENPGITIVQRLPGEGQRDKALRVTQDLLSAHPDLNGIFGINDDSALGALAAVETAGLQDKIAIVGFDGTPEAQDAIRAGKALKADIVQHPDAIGKTAIEIVAQFFNGQTPPAEVPVPVDVIDQAALAAKPAA